MGDVGQLEFDYIVVGAGSAGCIVASRLSEDPRTSVLLVESGPPDTSPLIHMPRGLARLMRPDSPYTWAYEVSRGNRGPEVWIKGKGLGGSSSINGMVYVRGHPADYDAWAAEGCVGWGWDEVRRSFMAMEDHELGEGRDRGVGGPLKITVQRPIPGLTEAVLDAAAAAGTRRVADTSSSPDGGFGYQAQNVWRGQRQSAAKAFLQPARGRANLTVVTETNVLRLVFEGRRAAWVDLRDRTGVRSVRARREIVLAAGAVESPKLLQISGVGPAAHLRRLGIDVVADAPEVGENLQDHFNLSLHFLVTRGSLNGEFAGPRLLLNLVRYAALRQGPLAHAAHEVSGFARTSPELARPNAHIGVGLYTMTRTPKGPSVGRQQGLTMVGYLGRPASRGVTRITTPDPEAAPFIDANYFSAQEDRRESVALVRYIRSIAAQPALKDYIRSEIKPGPDVATDEQIEENFLQNGVTTFHVSGTCRMGADAGSVVDHELRVRGVEGLRVADTSIMPKIVSGNTNATAMMIGWRAADLIRTSAA
jgi:choline dehydrogenase-like flavoprotein